MTSLNDNISHVTAWANVFECLLSETHSVFTLHEESGLALNTIRKLLRILKRRKRIYIFDWDRDSTPAGRCTIPVYALGFRPDAKRPPPKTSTERSRARYRRLKPTLFPTAVESNTMKLYKTTCTDEESTKTFTEFAASASTASKARTRLKKAGLWEIKTDEVDINTDRQSLIRFLNGMMAHESWTHEAATEKLTES